MNTLFIVATPIGNLQDITFRAIETLKSADAIICEDTRVTSKLLNHYGIKKPLLVLNDHNEETRLVEIVYMLERGQDLALVSDSGTPLISDPGFKLVREVKKRNLHVTPIPGPSAVIAALSASNVPTDKFLFLGFLPKSSSQKLKVLMDLKDKFGSNSQSKMNPTIVLYESPHELIKTLQALQEVFGDREISIGRELTKIHESISSAPIQELITMYQAKKPKGEFVILFSLKDRQ